MYITEQTEVGDGVRTRGEPNRPQVGGEQAYVRAARRGGSVSKDGTTVLAGTSDLKGRQGRGVQSLKHPRGQRMGERERGWAASSGGHTAPGIAHAHPPRPGR